MSHKTLCSYALIPKEFYGANAGGESLNAPRHNPE